MATMICGEEDLEHGSRKEAPACYNTEFEHLLEAEYPMLQGE